MGQTEVWCEMVVLKWKEEVVWSVFVGVLFGLFVWVEVEKIGV